MASISNLQNLLLLKIVILISACGSSQFIGAGATKTPNEQLKADESIPNQVQNPPAALRPFCAHMPLPENCEAVSGAGISAGTIVSDRALRSAKLSYQDMTGITFRSVDLSMACADHSLLISSHLESSTLTGANFAQSNFSNAQILESQLDEIDFGGANFSNAVLQNVDLSKTCVEGANFSRAILDASSRAEDLAASRSNFSNARFDEVDFSKAVFQAANLSQAIFSANAKFVAANFRGANFSGAEIDANANFFQADFSGATWIDGIKVCAENSIGSCQ